VVYAPLMQRLLGTVPLTFQTWIVMIMMGGMLVGVIEMIKWLFFRRQVKIG